MRRCRVVWWRLALVDGDVSWWRLVFVGGGVLWRRLARVDGGVAGCRRRGGLVVPGDGWLVDVLGLLINE